MGKNKRNEGGRGIGQTTRGTASRSIMKREDELSCAPLLVRAVSLERKISQRIIAGQKKNARTGKKNWEGQLFL